MAGRGSSRVVGGGRGGPPGDGRGLGAGQAAAGGRRGQSQSAQG